MQTTRSRLSCGDLLVGALDSRQQWNKIDRNYVLGRNRVRQKGLVCQRERGPICCGRLREGQNAKDAMTRARGPIAGRARRESRKGGFRADGGADRNPDQSHLTGRINTPSGRELPGRIRLPPGRVGGSRFVVGGLLALEILDESAQRSRDLAQFMFHPHQRSL
jgi:hypothetical protein